MKRALVLLFLLAGCCGASLPTPHGPVKSGSLTASYTEAVPLATGTVYSTARFIGTMDNVGIDLYAASGTAACTVAVEVSNRFNPAFSSPTDDTLWVTYNPSGFVAPANLTGAVSNYWIELIPLSGLYQRIKFVCSSGATTLTLTSQMKGG